MTWNRSEIRQARQTPLKPVFERLGHQLRATNNDNYVLLGLAPEVVIKNHYWVCADTGAAGNAIDFLVRVKASLQGRESTGVYRDGPEWR